ncbi:MAG TPA: hypothetical protein VHY20_13500 [Pirellulales bacterium]|jgi:CheY-like chemotaxis protein|nr:hypothetical protein [Pirellulales bacterium]
MRALLASSDLSIVSLASGAAGRNRVELQVAMSPAALAAAIESQPFDLAIFDLSMPALDIARAIESLRGRPAASLPGASLPGVPLRTVAFGPHVQEALLAAARSAGCDRVLSRGQFHSQIDGIVTSDSYDA